MLSPSRLTGVLVALAAFAFLIAGCGGGGSSSTTSGSENASAATGGKTVAGGNVPGLGAVLVDSKGLTVYLFEKDSGTASSCYGACAASWPPVIAGKPTAGEGAMSSRLGTTKRKDGSMQVTYAGHPLYTFAGDVEAGEATGNESTAFGGRWLALNEAGQAVRGTASAAEAASESGGGSYGGY